MDEPSADASVDLLCAMETRIAVAVATVLLAEMEKINPAGWARSREIFDKEGGVLTLSTSYSMAGLLGSKLTLTELNGTVSPLMSTVPPQTTR